MKSPDTPILSRVEEKKITNFPERELADISDAKIKQYANAILAGIDNESGVYAATEQGVAESAKNINVSQEILGLALAENGVAEKLSEIQAQVIGAATVAKAAIARIMSGVTIGKSDNIVEPAPALQANEENVSDGVFPANFEVQTGARYRANNGVLRTISRETENGKDRYYETFETGEKNVYLNKEKLDEMARKEEWKIESGNVIASGDLKETVEPTKGTTEKDHAAPRWDLLELTEALKKEKEHGAPLIREAQERRNKIFEGRGVFQMSKEDFDQHFSKGSFAVHEGLKQQNVRNCCAVAAIHAFSQSPSFELMVRTSMRRLPDGSWEVRLPLLDKDARVITIAPNEIQSQKNPGFLKKHGGMEGIMPDFRRTLDPVKASEGIRVLEAAYIKGKFGQVNRLSAEFGSGYDVLLQLGGKENFLEYSLKSSVYIEKEGKWEHPGLNTLSESNELFLNHFLETFDPDVYIATVNTKHLDMSKLSNKIREAFGLSTYKGSGTNKMFVARHAYSLTAVDKQTKIVTIANPWDTTKPITLTFQQFKETFNTVSAVRIHHAKLLENMNVIHHEE